MEYYNKELAKRRNEEARKQAIADVNKAFREKKPLKISLQPIGHGARSIGYSLYKQTKIYKRRHRR